MSTCPRRSAVGSMFHSLHLGRISRDKPFASLDQVTNRRLYSLRFFVAFAKVGKTLQTAYGTDLPVAEV